MVCFNHFKLCSHGLLAIHSYTEALDIAIKSHDTAMQADLY